MKQSVEIVNVIRIGQVEGMELTVVAIDKHNYVPIEALLYAMGVSEIKKVVEIMKSDLYFFAAIKTFTVNGSETLYIDIVSSLGFIFRVPTEYIQEQNDTMFSIRKQEVFTAYWAYTMKQIEFMHWKLESLTKSIEEYQTAVNEQVKLADETIDLQEKVINELKNLK